MSNIEVTRKCCFVFVFSIIAGCSDANNTTHEASGVSFETVMFKFMYLRDSTDFYNPGYMDIESEARRLKVFVDQACTGGCVLGVFTKDDEYTIELMTEYCKSSYHDDAADIVVILREDRNSSLENCGKLQVISYGHLLNLEEQQNLD